MFKSRRTYLFAFVVSGIAVGLTIYLYNRKRQKEHDKNSEDKTPIQMDRSCTDDKDRVVLNSDSSLPPSSDISLPSSIVTCSSSISSIVTCSSSISSLVTSSWSISLSDTSTSSSDVDHKYEQRNTAARELEREDEPYQSNTARGLEREDEPYVTPREFETQLHSPAVATWNQYSTVGQDVSSQQTVPLYSDSLSTFSHTMDQYNTIVTPNSPNTAWYFK